MGFRNQFHPNGPGCRRLLTMQLNICGPAYKLPNISANNQRCVNQYPTSAGIDGRGTDRGDKSGTKINLTYTAGLLELIDLGAYPIRSMETFGDFVYAVSGPNVYKVDINYLTKTATKTLIGTMVSSSGTVYAAANPTQIMWVDGTTKGYIYTIATGVFEEITSIDSDFPGGTQVTYLDGYFIVNAPGTGQFYVSAINNGRNWDALDVATAESSTDNIVGLNTVKGELWILGEETTEIWYDAANVTGSPFSNRKGLNIQIGCGAPDSIVKINDLLIWMDDRGYIVQSAMAPYVRDNNTGYDLKIVSDDAISTAILSYTRRDDAIACTYNDRGHLMYQISFPTAKKTWVFDYTTKAWHERSFYSSYNAEHQHHLVQFYCSFASLHLGAGVRTGKIYMMSSDYKDDDGDPIYRIRTTPFLYDQEDLKRITISKVELRIGIGDHEEPDPQVTMRYSHNGGHTWSHHMPRSIGTTGEWEKVITWSRLGAGKEWIFEFTIVEPIPYLIVDAIVRVSDVESI